MLFYIYQQQMVPDYHTKYEQKSTHSSLKYHNKYTKCTKNLPQLLKFGKEPNATLQA